MSGVLLVVSAQCATADGRLEPPRPGPRKDYAALAETLGATVLDYGQIRRSRGARLVARAFGAPVAQAWLAFRRRRSYDTVVTDGEHIGIPLALLLKATRARVPHVTIGHRVSSSKKYPFFRWLRVQTHISRIALHATLQYQLAISDAAIPPERLSLLPYQVDTDFWRPQPVPEERLVVSAGLEYRDYPTLFRAMDGLDARAVIGAASYWSRRANRAAGAAVPPNVTVGAFDYFALRDLYARAALVVVPLDDVDFQAGITTILEAMAMGKAVVVTHSRGQTDVVEDRRSVTRTHIPRTRPVSLLRSIGMRAGVTVEPNGFYVPPGDAPALRRAITYLLDHPAERARLGAAGRHAVAQVMSLDHFAARFRDLVQEVQQTDPEPDRGAPAGVRPRPSAVMARSA